VFCGTGGLDPRYGQAQGAADHADMFCTKSDGVRGQRAKEWRLVDDVVLAAAVCGHIKQRALKLPGRATPAEARGVALTPLKRTIDEVGLHYGHVDVHAIARRAQQRSRCARRSLLPNIAWKRPLPRGANWWPLQMARELDDAILTCVPANWIWGLDYQDGRKSGRRSRHGRIHFESTRTIGSFAKFWDRCAGRLRGSMSHVPVYAIG